MRVWVDDWQLQCCGEPFEIGSRVTWTVMVDSLEGVRTSLGNSSHVDAREDHHDLAPEDAPMIQGTVRAIYAVTFAFESLPGGGSQWAAGSARLRSITRAVGTDVEPMGYLVDIDVD